MNPANDYQKMILRLPSVWPRSMDIPLDQVIWGVESYPHITNVYLRR